MSDPDLREQRRKKFKRNVVAKFMYENKGAFAIKVQDPRKGEYKREKLKARDITLDDNESENYE